MVDSVCTMFSIATTVENVEGVLYELETSCCTDRTVESCQFGIDRQTFGFHVWTQFSRIKNRLVCLLLHFFFFV